MRAGQHALIDPADEWMRVALRDVGCGGILSLSALWVADPNPAVTTAR